MPEQNDREKLTNIRYERDGKTYLLSVPQSHASGMQAALAAPPVIDEAKLGETIYRELSTRQVSISFRASSAIAHALVEHRDEWLGGTR